MEKGGFFGGKGACYGFKGGGFMPPGGAWGGKGKQRQDFGVPGLEEALTEVLTPFDGQDPQWNLEEMKLRVGQKMAKAAFKFSSDERLKQKGSATLAKLVVEELIDACMGAVASGCYDKPWFPKVNYYAPMLACVLYSFQGAKVLTRTLPMALENHVAEGLFKWVEEEKIQKVIAETIDISDIQESYKKKAKQHLAKTYDEAYSSSPFGTNNTDPPELGILMDFIKGWMREFAGRAYDVLNSGLNAGNSKDEQVIFLTALFQKLAEDGNAALPLELTSALKQPLSDLSHYIAQCAEEVLLEMEMESGASAKRRKAMGGNAITMGKGFGKSW